MCYASAVRPLCALSFSFFLSCTVCLVNTAALQCRGHRDPPWTAATTHHPAPHPAFFLSRPCHTQVVADIAQLESLVAAHDVVFLLTDTRESRWLPTLLAAAAGKLAVNSALGFDGFMVMRHGAPPLPPAAAAQRAQEAEAQAGRPGREGEQEAGGASGSSSSSSGAVGGGSSLQEGPRLGCYFCNDVVAPINSTGGRSLLLQVQLHGAGTPPACGCPVCAPCAEPNACVFKHCGWLS